MNSSLALPRVLSALSLAAFTLLTTTASAALHPGGGQDRSKLPRENVIDVPAIGTGLCVSNVFQSNMVLQRDRPLRIWGWAAPGEEVTVSLGGSEASARARENRRFDVSLPAMGISANPLTMTVRGATETLRLDNILMGDVWILGGQSNMEFELAKVENGELEIASANLPQLRILTVPYGYGPEPRESFDRLHEWSDWFKRHFRKGDWDICSPDVARELSAIGYAFASRLHLATGVPIGVIDASRGGTSVETWISREILANLNSGRVDAKLKEWDDKIAAWIPGPDAKPNPRDDMNNPGNCHAGMLSPLIGLSVKGAIFHQGYNNALDGMRGVRLYQKLLPVMIETWREAFQDPNMPFGIVAQCTDGYPQTRENYLEKMINAGIHIRAAHYETFKTLHDAGDDNIGFASTYDLRRRWYHPQVKVPAGLRMARWALATEYGFERQLPWKPPALVQMEAQDGALRLQLDAKVSDPLDGRIEGFVIAGEDRRFQIADVAYVQTGVDDRGRPKLDRSQLLLSSPLVEHPIHFRYAWGRNPLANLQVQGNKDLPFATQRSDSWDMGTVPLGVLDEPVDEKMTRAQQNAVRRALREEDLRRRLAEARALLEEHGDK
ncbi:MAG: hypothetical protein AAGG01_08540 [Planctomycetota bacterium]